MPTSSLGLVEVRADEIRADRRGHQRRLAQLLPSLTQKFEDSKTPEVIRACANAILNDFDTCRSDRSCSRSPTDAYASAYARTNARHSGSDAEIARQVEHRERLVLRASTQHHPESPSEQLALDEAAKVLGA